MTEVDTAMMSNYGATSVTLSEDLLNALTTLNVEAAGFGSTQISNGVADFSITGGAADVDDVQVEIAHTGGLTFTAGETEVALTDFVISNLGETPQLTGLVTVNGDLVGRVALFDLQLGEVDTVTEADLLNLDLSGVGVTLTEAAATALNQAFDVTAFTAGLEIGTAQVDTSVNPETGDLVGTEPTEPDAEAETPTTPEQMPVVSAPEQASLFATEPTEPTEPTTPTTPTTPTPPDAAPAATLDVTSAGETSVTLSSELVDALGALNVQATGFGGTQIENGVADFLITGGAADLGETQVEILHNGGLTLTAGETAVNLTDFVVSNLGDSAVLTGLVSVNGDLLTRAPLFDLQVGGVESSTQDGKTNLDLTDVEVTLSETAATTLNQVFGTTAFEQGLAIGTAQVDASLA